MNANYVVKLLRKMKGSRRWKSVARELGISPSYLSDVLHGNRGPGSAMLKKLGVKQIVKVMYRMEDKNGRK